MTAAKRKNPAPSNGGNDNGTLYAEAVNVEDTALWRCVPQWLTTVAGTANVITATSDTSLVEALTAYARPLAVWLIPAVDNSGPATLNIDALGAKDIRDSSGAVLGPSALKGSSLHLLLYDGTVFRLAGGFAVGNSNSAPDMIVRDEKASGTSGGTFTSGSMVKRTLNTVVRNVISGASLASSQISLPAGTYYMEWSAPAREVLLHQSQLYNATDATVVESGESGLSDSGSGNAVTRSAGQAVFTIPVAKAFEIQHRCTVTRTPDGLGPATSIGAKEVYAWVRIWKVGAGSGGSTTSVREKLFANRTYYVRSGGNDSQDGLANTNASALLTVQAAIDLVHKTLDLNGQSVTIQVTGSVFIGAVSVIGPFVGAKSRTAVQLLGDPTTPANCNLLTQNTDSVITADCGAFFAISGFKLTSSGGGFLVDALRGGNVLINGKVDIGATVNSQLVARRLGQVEITSPYTISAGGLSHYQVNNNGVIIATTLTVTLTGTPNFTGAFVGASTFGSMNLAGNVYSGSATGKQWNIPIPAGVNTGGASASLPGNATGTGIIY